MLKVTELPYVDLFCMKYIVLVSQPSHNKPCPKSGYMNSTTELQLT